MSHSYIFFGSSHLSAVVLEELCNNGMKPKAIVTTPDRPKGRKLLLTPPEVKVLGEKYGIPIFQFAKLDSDAISTIKGIAGNPFAYFLVASYGLIIPQAVLDIPTFGTLNIHPSLLPKYRGATPIQSAVLDDDRETGITIMLIDAKMDHGDILIQEKRKPTGRAANDSGDNNEGDTKPKWPIPYLELEEEFAKQGAGIIIKNIDAIIDGTIKPVPQDHDKATFTKKIQKADGELSLDSLSGSEGRKQFLKFNAYSEWPASFFFVDIHDKKMRVKVTEAKWIESEDRMDIIKVIPEGQKETLWSEFKKKI